MAIISAIPFMLIGMFALPAIYPLLTADAEVSQMGQVGLRALAVAFIPLGFVLVLGNVFNALGNGILNMKCSMIRGGISDLQLSKTG